MKRILLLTTTSMLFCVAMLQAQNVFNPADPIVRWNSSAALGTAANPNPNIAGLQKWVSVASNGVSTGNGAWDNSSYKAYYINLGQGMAFRLKFPKSYTNPDSASKKYPVMLFFHGAGEPGCNSNGNIYNNERQLTHGGKTFKDRVDNGSFDGFLFYPQIATNSNSCSSNWGVAPYTPWYNLVLRVIDSLAKYSRLDIDRVFVDGLSNGGATAWSITSVYPQRIAGAAPSAAATGATNFNDFVHIPIWFASGGKDSNPTPGFALGVYNALKAVGSAVKYTLYPDKGHGIWGDHWNEAGFTDFMNAAHKANPLIFFQRDEFCPDSPINVKLGITAGFTNYEWQKDGVTIATTTNNSHTIIDGTSIISYTGNEITVKSFGTYRVRFKRSNSGDWSVWSPIPAVIKSKPITQTPNIQVNGLKSKVLPAPDGSTSVQLSLPEGYVSYQWFQGATVVGTESTYVAQTGTYTAKVIEQFGCGALPSPAFTVIHADGSPKPEPAKNLSAAAVSLTSIRLDWSDNPNASENETGFEIYRSTNPGGPYQLVTITPANTITYTNTGLTSNTQYYYIIRAVGASGAAAVSNEADAKTEVDNTGPTAPSNLKLLNTFTTYLNVQWTGSTDDVGVDKYDIFINGLKTYTTTQTTFTIANLDSGQLYTIHVKARDAVGNYSAPSNQITVSTKLAVNGLTYKYFEGTWSTLPNFQNLTPVKSGTISNVNVSPRNRTDNFGFLWEGYINIPTTATYTFEVCSDDGSKLYIDNGYAFSNTALISHDGVHSNTCKTANIALTAGVHAIALAYFDGTGGDAVSWSWQNNAGLAKQAIPNSALFTNEFITPTITAPSNLVATGVAHNKINLTWTDNSNNEAGFEILRSATPAGTYTQVATVTGTSYTDSGLVANTKYYYKIRAIGLSGESVYASNIVEVNWKVNNNGGDSNGSGSRTLTLTGATYSNTSPKEGSHSLNLSGNSQYATVNNSNNGGFPSDGGYSQRTVAMWINPTSTSNRKVIFDFGNSTNGLALRFNNGDLEAGIASNSIRSVATLANFASNANWISGNWNHVAVVYNVNSLKLFLNGVEVAADNDLGGITSVVAAASNTARIGYSGGSNSDVAFNQAATSSDYFAGKIDDIYIFNSAMVAEEINHLKNFTFAPSSAATLVTPAAPTAPSGLAATPVSPTTVDLTWNDNSATETGFEIWRSPTDNSNYRVVATVPAGNTTFSDTTLFANVTYYYKVRATGLANPSAYSNEVTVVTPNTAPVFVTFEDFTIKHGTVHTLTVHANDPDGDVLNFSAENLPYFATLQNQTNGSVDIVSAPSIADQGAYAITVYVADAFGGKDTIVYNMVVNNNSLPNINAIADVTMNEGEARSLALVANDADGNSSIVWTVIDKPSFATLVDSGNGRASISLQPNLASSGTYTMTVRTDDGNGGWSNKTFTIIVNEHDPNETIQVNMKYYTGGVAGWNDVETASGNFSLSNLKNTKGVTTTVSVNKLSGTFGASDAGVLGGGVYPNNVMKDGIFWGFSWQGGAAVDTLRIRVSGLDVAKKYNFIFMGSNNCTFCGLTATSTTTYQIGNESVAIPYFMNATITDTIYQVQPAANGDVIITMIGDPNPGVGGVLNAFVIDAQFDDGTTPAKPANLLAEAEAGVGVHLNWTDKAYNEYSYKVYRATSQAGPYTLLNTLGVDANTYTDEAVLPFTQYYYYVAGSNNHGLGATSDTVAITTANNKPVIAGLVASIAMKTDANNQDDFTVTDTPGDVVTVSIVNQPSYITLQSLGGNNYRIIAAPTASDLGNVTFTVKAVDDKGAEVTSEVTIAVTDKNTRSVYINVGNYGDVAPAPWNNINAYGNNGTVLNNLKDENNATTPFSFQLIGGWAGISPIGHETGNNSGVYPDVVLKSGWWHNNDDTKQIRFSGLDNSKRYNVIVVGSQNEGLDASARYTSGSSSDTLNARYNTNQTANINNLTPSAGVITVDMNKLSSATYMFFTAVQLEEFTPGLNLNPINLYVEPKDRNAAILSWSDRTNNEDAVGGFQLQRATDAAFANVTSFDLPANTTTYTSTGLTPNTKYWYRVRAKVGGVYTDWSNVGKTITPMAITYVNFNFATEYNAPAPWYNLTALPTDFYTFNNLPNQSNQPTGMSLSITKVMNGDNNFGVITGNNSGFAPDVVLQSNYWIDNTQQSQMKLSGLNMAKRYRIGFFNSMSTNGWFAGNYTCTYTINGRTVYLNSWMNSTKVVYIGDVQSDSNGELLLDFSTTETAVYGFNGGIIVQAYDDVPEGGTVLNGGLTKPGEMTGTVSEEAAARTTAQATQEVTEGRMYPNPFIDQVNLDFNNTAADNNVSVDVYDLSGKLVFRKAFGKLAAGYNTLRVNTGSANLNTGIYMVTLNVNGKPVQVSKMIKANQ
jgi:chitodextrinase/pimeloyl-ACP methyl ester carboxylesterase